jgi:hypothetical protein
MTTTRNRFFRSSFDQTRRPPSRLGEQRMRSVRWRCSPDHGLPTTGTAAEPRPDVVIPVRLRLSPRTKQVSRLAGSPRDSARRRQAARPDRITDGCLGRESLKRGGSASRGGRTERLAESEGIRAGHRSYGTNWASAVIKTTSWIASSRTRSARALLSRGYKRSVLSGENSLSTRSADREGQRKPGDGPYPVWTGAPYVAGFLAAAFPMLDSRHCVGQTGSCSTRLAEAPRLITTRIGSPR